MGMALLSLSLISSLEDDFLFASLYGPHTQRLTGLAASPARLVAAAAWHNAVSDAEKEDDINIGLPDPRFVELHSTTPFPVQKRI